MFLDLAPSSNAYAYPLVSNIGSLFQVLPDRTQATLRFSGAGNAPGNSSLNIRQSVGGIGPWTTAYQDVFALNGIPLSDVPTFFAGPYQQNNFFEYRWENTTLGYVGPWLTLAGPTVKGRWDVTSGPIAPDSIPAINLFTDGFEYAIDVDVEHSLDNSGNYSNTGILVSATGLVSGFPVTHEQYFATGWGSVVGAVDTYRINFGSIPNLTPTGASATYYVLGELPPPSILGTPVNF